MKKDDIKLLLFSVTFLVTADAGLIPSLNTELRIVHYMYNNLRIHFLIQYFAVFCCMRTRGVRVTHLSSNITLTFVYKGMFYVRAFNYPLRDTLPVLHILMCLLQQYYVNKINLTNFHASVLLLQKKRKNHSEVPIFLPGTASRPCAY